MKPPRGVRFVRRRRSPRVSAQTVLIVVIAVIALLAIAALGPLFIPTSFSRGWIERQVAGRLEARVQMRAFRFRLLPYPGYTITGFGLISLREPYRGLPLVTAEKIRGSLSFWDLLAGRVDTAITATGVAVDERIEAGGAPQALPPDPFADAGGALSIRSIRISKGRFNRWDGGTIVLSIEDVELEAIRLLAASGAGADIRMGGRVVAGPAPFPFGVAGRLFVDPPRREVAAQGMKGTIFGAQTVVDFSVNYGAAPVSFDIHLASPDLNPQAASSLLALMGGVFPAGFSWQGPIATDLSLKGTRESMALSAQIDAATARFAIGSAFVKGAGLPFKASFDAILSPQSFSLQQGTVTLGQQIISIGGQIDRAEGSPFQFTIGGTGLGGDALKVFLPQLSLLEAMEGADLSLNIAGAAAGDLPLKVGGQFKAKRLVFAGLELADAEGAFEEGGADAPPDAVAFPAVRGVFADGALSGNGQLRFTAQPAGGQALMEFSFDGVIDRAQVSAIPALAGVMGGEASLVVKATASGADASALAAAMKLAGSLVVKNGTWKGARLPPMLFSADLWGEIESALLSKLDVSAEEKLSGAGDEFIDFSASFEASSGTLAVSECSWTQGPFEAKAKVEIDAGHLVRGDGTILLSKAAAEALVPQPALRRALLDSDGRLGIPVRWGGRLPALEIGFEKGKVAAMVKERVAALPPQKPAKKAAEPVPAAQAPRQRPPDGVPQAQPPKRKATASAPKEEGAPAPRPSRAEPKGGKRSAPPSDEQVEDMLKVIIGQ